MAPLTAQQRVFTVAGVLLAIFLAALDQTVVATAGPSILRSLELDPGLYTWMTTSYLVASTVLVPVFGRVSDVVGRRRVVLWGTGLFLLGSALCGAATSGAQLIAFRAIQGSGSACIFTSAFALAADLFTPVERGRYSGLFGSVFAVSSLVGPVVGGFLTDGWGWRWAFWANLPLGLVALAVCWRFMPPLVPHLERRPRVDLVGALLLTVGTVPLLVGLSLGRPELVAGEVGLLWTDPRLLALFAVAFAALPVFVWWERRVADPLVDLTLFRDATVRWGAGAVFALGGAFLAPMVFLPLFMVNVVGVTATASGLTVTPLVLGVVAGNLLAGQAVARLGRYRGLMLGGLVVLLAAAGVLAFTLGPDASQATVTVKLLLLGLGLGPSIPLYTIAVQDVVPEAEVGVATSLVTFFRQLGQVVGVAVAGSLFATSLSASLRARVPDAIRRLPPRLAARLDPGLARGGGGGGEVTMHFDPARVREQALDQLAGARRVAHGALEGEALALALVKDSPYADARLRALAEAGGVAASVGARYRAELERLEAGAARDPRRRGAALEQARAALEAQRRDEVARVLAEEEGRVDQALERTQGALLEAIDAVGLAMRESFAEATRRAQAVALALAVLALLFTWPMPARALKAGPPPSPALDP